MDATSKPPPQPSISRVGKFFTTVETYGTPLVAADEQTNERTNEQTDKQTYGHYRCVKPSCGGGLKCQVIMPGQLLVKLFQKFT